MSDQTVHKLTTVHSLLTPHKLPNESATQLDILRDLSVQLYPTGRAWYRPENGAFQNFHDAVNISFVRLLEDMQSFIDSTFPDNPNFTVDDAALWEFRLGLITNTSISLEDRKQALIRKLGHPNNIKARQHPFFIQEQLQLAGFDVYVHENTIPYQTPEDINSVSPDENQHGGDSQHGDGFSHGGNNFDVIANSIEPSEQYSVGGNANLWATFFIGGQVLGDMATVPASRLREFKELVIKLKPAHTVAFTFINYT